MGPLLWHEFYFHKETKDKTSTWGPQPPGLALDLAVFLSPSSGCSVSMCSMTNTWTRPGPVAVSQVAHLPDPCHLTHMPLFQLPWIQTRQEFPGP